MENHPQSHHLQEEYAVLITRHCFSATTIGFTLNTYSATKKEPLLEVDPVIADRILFAADPGKIEAERPRLAPSPPGPSSAKKHLSYICKR